MMRRWSIQDDTLEIAEMPFYWRLPTALPKPSHISSRLPIRLTADEELDYLCLRPSPSEWAVMEEAYRSNATIGFLNVESGQANTYGASVNRFLMNVLTKYQPRSVYEVGCGAGHSIKHAQAHGWNMVGIDPSEYALRSSELEGFELIHAFFESGTIPAPADLIFCNDVFEHIPDVCGFAEAVHDSLVTGGVFAFCTTDSTSSMRLGDISMLEHQHVNMFSSGSIRSILERAGFAEIDIGHGGYGGTFHVTAIKGLKTESPPREKHRLCDGFLDRCVKRLEGFERFFDEHGEDCGFYVPLRCIPYLAAIGVFDRRIYDSNIAWHGGIIDGYEARISGPADLQSTDRPERMFIGSVTFREEISSMLLQLGFPRHKIFGIGES